MQINSRYPRARADWFRKSGTPPVRPQSHALHLDGLRASLDPLLGDLASQYLGPLQTPPRGRRQRTQETKRPRKKLSNQPMPGPFASRHSQRHRSTYQPKALEITPLAKRKASRAQHFSTSCAPARCRTYQLAVGAFASSSAWKVVAALGVRSGLILHRRGLMACETPSGLIIFYLSPGLTISLNPLGLKP